MSKFGIDTKVFFGRTAHEELHAFIADFSFQNIMPIIDDALMAHKTVKEIIDHYKKAGYDICESQIVSAKNEPTYDQLDRLTDSIKNQKVDLILAIGGGTVIDLAKGVAVLLKNLGKGVDYRGMDKVKNPSVPVIAYPTTAGTGTEVTWTASFVDTHEGKKLGINGKNVTPLCGVLDPRLVASCSNSVAVSSGLDAMLHAIEAVTAKTATEITRILGSKAFALVYQYLPRCLANRDDLNAWGQGMLGVYIAAV